MKVLGKNRNFENLKMETIFIENRGIEKTYVPKIWFLEVYVDLKKVTYRRFRNVIFFKYLKKYMYIFSLKSWKYNISWKFQNYCKYKVVKMKFLIIACANCVPVQIHAHNLHMQFLKISFKKIFYSSYHFSNSCPRHFRHRFPSHWIVLFGRIFRRKTGFLSAANLGKSQPDFYTRGK